MSNACTIVQKENTSCPFDKASSLVMDALSKFFGDKFEGVNDLLLKYGGFISGSIFPLAANGQTRGWNDVDVFFNVSKHYHIDKLLKEFSTLYEKKECNKLVVFDTEKPLDWTLHYSNYLSIANICKVVNACENIQLIFRLSNDSPKATVNAFDLDICKNYYNGRHVYFHNLDGILKKEMNVELIDYSNQIDNFVTKIKCQHNYRQNLLESRFSRAIKRVIKYYNRGFNAISIRIVDERTKSLHAKLDHMIVTNFVDCNELRKFVDEVKKSQDKKENHQSKEPSLARKIADVKFRLSQETMSSHGDVSTMLTLVDQLEELQKQLETKYSTNEWALYLYQNFKYADLEIFELFEQVCS